MQAEWIYGKCVGATSAITSHLVIPSKLFTKGVPYCVVCGQPLWGYHHIPEEPDPLDLLLET